MKNKKDRRMNAKNIVGFIKNNALKLLIIIGISYSPIRDLTHDNNVSLLRSLISDLKCALYVFPVETIVVEFEDKLTTPEVRTHAREMYDDYLNDGKGKAKIAALRVIYRSPEAIMMLKRGLGNDEYYTIIEKTIR